MSCPRAPIVAAAALASASAAAPAAAQGLLTVEIRPAAGDLQLAVWVEDAGGAFVETLMVTRLVGTFGLGNRPGRGDLESGYLWPYGRREMALPVWAHRRGASYQRLVFQDCHESDLGYHERTSSEEPFYCRPTTPGESGVEVDAITCPTAQFNADKGMPLALVDPGADPDCAALVGRESPISLYPPRNDLLLRDPVRDWDGVLSLAAANDLDAVSRATPAAGEVVRLAWRVPADLPPGEYAVWVEAGRERDFSARHEYPAAGDPRLPDYGRPFAGQPSVLWRAPIAIGPEPAEGTAAGWAGYGAPDGADGELRPPDGTIADAPGSGAGRLLPLAGAARARAAFEPVPDCPAPAPVAGLRERGADFSWVEVELDPSEGAARYQVRVRQGRGAIDGEDEFLAAVPAAVVPAGAGPVRARVAPLRPQTRYTVAVRAVGRCGDASEPAAIDVTTPEREFATVPWCFVATATYGSPDAAHVAVLRRFRDRVLARSAPGRALRDLYYRVSPPLARAVARHARLRALARAALDPIVQAVRWML